MTVRLITAPAGAGKTHACIERVRSVSKQIPMAQVWVVLPDRNQANAFNRRLAKAGGALGVQVGIFQDLYLELLAIAGKSVLLAPEPLVHRLTRAAIDKLAKNSQLHHYLPIVWRPGFTQAVSELDVELKRELIPPEQFAGAVTVMASVSKSWPRYMPSTSPRSRHLNGRTRKGSDG